MKTFIILLRRWLSEALDVLLPTECAACREPGSTLCIPCRQRLEQLQQRPLFVSDHAAALPLLPLSADSLRDTEAELPILPVYAAAAYLDEVASVIWAIKEQARPQLASYFAEGFSRAIEAALTHSGEHRATLLVPIPATARSRQQRGYWPLHEFYRRTSISQDAFHVLEAPSRTGSTFQGAQKLRGKAARAQAVAGSLSLNPVLAAGLRHRQVVLIDDVLTTGATLAEAYRVLTGAGFEVVAAAVVAATLPAGKTRQKQ